MKRSFGVLGGRGNPYDSPSVYTNPNTPTIPLNFRLISVTDNSATVAWDAAGDFSSIPKYRIYIKVVSNYILQVSLTNVLTYTFTSLIPGTNYVFAVTAYNDTNNESDYSNDLSVTTTNTDTTAPDKPIIVIDDPAVGSLVSTVRQWTSYDAVGVVGWYITDVARGGGEPTAPAYDAGGWLSSVPTSYTLSDPSNRDVYGWNKDYAGNVSLASDLVQVDYTTSGTEAIIFANPILSGKIIFANPHIYGAQIATPIAPTAVNIEIKSSIWLRTNWTPPINVAGYTKYYIYRQDAGTGGFNLIGYQAIGVNYYDDNNLLPETLYEYKIKSAVGTTLSEFSNIASETTPAAEESYLPAPTITSTTATSPYNVTISITIPQYIGTTTEYHTYSLISGGSPELEATNIIDPNNVPATLSIQATVLANTTYTFFVRASDGTLEGADSNTLAPITTPASSGYSRTVDFESGILGGSAQGAASDLFDSLAGDTIIANYGGHSKCAKLQAIIPNTLEEGMYGSWGGAVAFDRAYSGNTITISLDYLWPTGYNATNGTGFLKFLRLKKGGVTTPGFLDFGLIGQPLDFTNCGDLGSAYYTDSEYASYDGCAGDYGINNCQLWPDQWVHYDWIVKLGVGTGTMACKVNGSYINFYRIVWSPFSRVLVGQVATGINTIQTSNTYVDQFFLHTYWNGGPTYPTTDQISYVDNIVITVE